MRRGKGDEGRVHLVGIKGQEILVRVEVCTRRGRVIVFENLRLAVGDVVRVTFPDEPARVKGA